MDTKISDLPISATEFYQCITLKYIDQSALTDAMNQLNISTVGHDDSFSDASTQLKVNYVCLNNKVKLKNLVELHKQESRVMIQKFILQWAISVSSARRYQPPQLLGSAGSANIDELCGLFGALGKPSGSASQPGHSSPAPVSSTTAGASSSTSTTTTTPSQPHPSAAVNIVDILNKINSSQDFLASLFCSMQTNMNAAKDVYAKTPSSDPPKYTSSKKNTLSLRRFFTNNFSRWLIENKLRPEDTFIYLHKVFTDKNDQDRAFSIIQDNKHSGIDRVLEKLGEYFSLNEVEIFALNEKFYGYKIGNNSNFEACFNELYELQASIMAADFDEADALSTAKIQFQRCVSNLSSFDASTLRATFVTPRWTKAKTLDAVLQLLRLILGRQKTNETQKQDSQNSVKSHPKPQNSTVAHPDDMDCSAISNGKNSSGPKKGKKSKKKKYPYTTYLRNIPSSPAPTLAAQIKTLNLQNFVQFVVLNINPKQ